MSGNLWDNEELILRIYFTLGTIGYVAAYLTTALLPEITEILYLRIIAIPVFLSPVIISYIKELEHPYMDISIFMGIQYSIFHNLILLSINDFAYIGLVGLYLGIGLNILTLIMFIDRKVYGLFLFLEAIVISLIAFFLIDLVFAMILSFGIISFTFFGYLALIKKIHVRYKLENISSDLNIFVSNSPFVYFILNKTGDFLLSRGGGLKEIGLKRDQIVGMNVYDLYGEYPELLNAISKALHGEEAEHLTYVKESNLYWDTKLIPVQNGDDFKMIGISTNVTPIIEKQNQILKHERELLRIQRFETLGKFATGISHEFNNLLTIFQNITELLLIEGGLSQPQIELIQELNETTERGKNITSQLQSYGKKKNLEFELFDLNQLIVNMTKLLDLATKSKNINISLELTDTEIIVYADKGSLHQVLLNLILNGIDSIELKGSILVKTSLYVSENGNEYANIVIRDTGEGISSEILENIFDPFFTTKDKGLGLGLSTSQSIITQLGGRIEVTSIVGEGSKFEITLPLPTEDEIEQYDIEEKSSILDVIDLKQSKILVIDDEPAISRLLDKILTSKNGQVMVTNNGKEALKAIAADPHYDLIISDIKMPEMDGIELFYSLLDNERYEHLVRRFIFISGYTEFIDEIKKFQQKYYVKLLNKPFLIETLLNEIKSILDL